jgi:hypothetical protein
MVRQGFRQHGHRRVDVLLQYIHGGAAGVRFLAGQHFVEDDAEAVEIGARVEHLTECLLGAHVVWRAAQHAGAGAGCAAIQRTRLQLL